MSLIDTSRGHPRELWRVQPHRIQLYFVFVLICYVWLNKLNLSLSLLFFSPLSFLSPLPFLLSLYLPLFLTIILFFHVSRSLVIDNLLMPTLFSLRQVSSSFGVALRQLRAGKSPFPTDFGDDFEMASDFGNFAIYGLCVRDFVGRSQSQMMLERKGRIG